MGAAAAVEPGTHAPDDFSLVVSSCRARCSMFSVVDAEVLLIVKSAAPSQAPDVHPLLNLKSLLFDATTSGVPASVDSAKRRSRVADRGEMMEVDFELVEAVD